MSQEEIQSVIQSVSQIPKVASGVWWILRIAVAAVVAIFWGGWYAKGWVDSMATVQQNQVTMQNEIVELQQMGVKRDKHFRQFEAASRERSGLLQDKLSRLAGTQ
ncbi:MAG TPA: hypothetical protein VG944_20335 [Fimbriimonas sp.]|nr:hypothetical protein [Fimbriimonas sp.]